MKFENAGAERMEDGGWEVLTRLSYSDTVLLVRAIKLLEEKPGDPDDKMLMDKIKKLKDEMHEAWKRTNPS